MAFDGKLRNLPPTYGRLFHSKDFLEQGSLRFTGYSFFRATEGQEDYADF